MREKYEELCAIARQDSYIQSSLSLLEWDQQTKMPTHAAAYRADQITYFAGELHRRKTDKRRGELLDTLIESDLAKRPGSDSTATIVELKREYDKKIRLPQSLVEAIARAASEGQQVWVEARHANDFQKFAPSLESIFKLKREEADALGFEDEPYDALLDEYEPGTKTQEVREVLAALKSELVPLINKIQSSRSRVETDVLKREFPVAAQEKFCKEAAEKIGFDFGRGRLDVTHHPFCTEAGPEDVRITTRYDANFFSSAFFGTLHEAGHGIYEQGLRSDQYGLPPGQYCSLGIHESQSRLWENLVGRSRPFWDFFYGSAQSHFTSLNDVSVDEFYRAINQVAPSLIRVEADEVTYNLHIIIRFELEQDILNGAVPIGDLPEAWNAKYDDYLQIRPDSDANGVLQDVHWSAGLFGYFPTYALGNLYASQFFEQAESELGNLGEMFSRGEFSSLKHWLQREIHQHGKCYRSEELGKRVVKKPLSHEPLVTHLKQKLEPIYGI